MTFDEYESAAGRTVNTALTGPERLLDAAAGLAEEAGEVLGMVRKNAFQSRPLAVDRLEEELGDALWCLAIAARSAGLSLERIAAGNVAKLARRYPGGYPDAAGSGGR